MKKIKFNNISNFVIDIFVVIFVTIIFLIIFLKFDFFDLLVDFVHTHEDYELDEFVLTLLILPLPLIWFSIRRYNEYKILNKELEERIKIEVKKQIKQEKILISQSKNAAMGEMIANISHQWKQPLTSVSTITSGLKLKLEYKDLKEEDLNRSFDIIIKLVDYLSTTVDTFRNFLTEEKILEKVNIVDTIQKSLYIVKVPLDDTHIELEHNLENLDPIEIRTIPNEIKEVIINIINNAKDAIVEKKINDGKISINLSKNKNDSCIIKIQDNGGGIPDNFLEQIFKPYFTTKKLTNGTGLGLYMSHNIIVKSLKGKIKVENKDSGALFTLTIPNLTY